MALRRGAVHLRRSCPGSQHAVASGGFGDFAVLGFQDFFLGGFGFWDFFWLMFWDIGFWDLGFRGFVFFWDLGFGGVGCWDFRVVGV